ncbi:MAG TPA: type IV toxin-antitoxin system AbiEi family antitoxin [Bryobacteraceae bacterium]|jgi:hypothetical protein|nr:type IV toxin-antitoxin system AbiEi family antitoxin [Bryobacteraceae bacterium]
MTPNERSILDAAITAAGRTTGIEAHVNPAKAGKDRAADAIVEFEAARRKYRFGAEIKVVDRFETPAILKARNGVVREPLLLVAPYISREVGERCRQLRLPFIDTAGNAYLEGPGLLMYIVGQPRPVENRLNNYRALNPAGLKITFALLCQPELVCENYRRIATDAGVALGTVSADMKDLEGRGFFDLRTKPHPRHRKLLDPERMLEEWVTHYPVTLRPKLMLGRFNVSEPEHLYQLDLVRQKALWGAEPAATKLTAYLKPARFTIYTCEPVAKLVAAGRMRAAENGNVEILEKFWKFDPPAHDFPDVVPPILAYADLLASHDDRNAEVARMIYEERIAKTFRRAA